MTTTPVVPSPISLSWLLESSTSRRPIWFSTSICSRMVAPSLAVRRVCSAPHYAHADVLMVTSPSGDCSILSIPFGPKDERKMRATAFAAAMLAFCAASPWSLCFLSCSCGQHHGELLRDLMHDEALPTLMMMYGLPNSSNARDMAMCFHAAHAAVDGGDDGGAVDSIAAG